jgi:hypothetical protein
LPRYTVSFHVDAPAWMRERARVRYVVVYVRDPRTGEGFVYVPARGEQGYTINAGTIERSADEGKWHRAGARWASALNSRIP